MEKWIELEEFPGYALSNHGRVCHQLRGHIMTQNRNQQGCWHVALSKNGRQVRRSVALLVARHFLPSPPSEAFDTPINLDGIRNNNNYWNLLWRPKWFAMRYHRQFEWAPNGSIKVPIEEINTGEVFPNSWTAALKYGLLDREIYEAMKYRTHVWPTYQRFTIYEN